MGSGEFVTSGPLPAAGRRPPLLPAQVRRRGGYRRPGCRPRKPTTRSASTTGPWRGGCSFPKAAARTGSPGVHVQCSRRPVHWDCRPPFRRAPPRIEHLPHQSTGTTGGAIAGSKRQGPAERSAGLRSSTWEKDARGLRLPPLARRTRLTARAPAARQRRDARCRWVTVQEAPRPTWGPFRWRRRGAEPRTTAPRQQPNGNGRRHPWPRGEETGPRRRY
jgi:hypothetical protein